MAIQTTVESLRIRFEFHLNLLHQLFNASSLPFGLPADLTLFAERLNASDTLAEDTAVLLTAMIRLEEPVLNRLDLLDILCVAVGGTTADGSGTAFRPALWKILVFINGVLLSARQSTLPEITQAPARSAAEAPQTGGFEVDDYILERFDLPSNLTSVERGEDALDEDPDLNGSLVGTYILGGTYDSDGKANEFLAEKRTAVATYTEPVQAASAVKVWETTNGSDSYPDIFEPISLDEKPASITTSVYGSKFAAKQIAQGWPSRGAVLIWSVGLACAATAGFLLGTLAPRYAKPCSAAPAFHGLDLHR